VWGAKGMARAKGWAPTEGEKNQDEKPELRKSGGETGGPFLPLEKKIARERKMKLGQRQFRDHVREKKGGNGWAEEGWGEKG